MASVMKTHVRIWLNAKAPAVINLNIKSKYEKKSFYRNADCIIGNRFCCLQ
jgi:hypothetical protein